MNRKKVFYLAILIAAAVVLLVLLAICCLPAMLAVVLILVLITGVNYRSRRHTTQKTDGSRTGGQKHAVRRISTVLVLENGGTVQQIVVNKEKFSIGSNAACDFVLNQQYISGIHAVILTDMKEKRVYITDHHSHNGVFLNGSRIRPDQPVQLAEGDIIQLCTIRFTVQKARF